MPIDQYFRTKRKQVRPKVLISQEAIYFKLANDSIKKRKFRLFKESELKFDKDKVKKNLIERYNDDDYDTDDDIMKAGAKRIERDLEYVFNELIVLGTSRNHFVRNLRKPRKNPRR